MSIFGVSMMNPIMWGGLLAAGIPLLVHLLTRHTPVRILFPSIRFLKSAKASQSRMYQIRHWLMLLLRTAIVLLILAAFLRPVYDAGALSEGKDNKKGNAAVIVIDTSLSMGYTGSGVTPFAQAKVAAQSIIDHLNGEDVANVIMASASPKAAFDKLTASRYQLKQDIEKAKATQERADVDGAIALALKQFEDHGEYKREIHIISDFQRTGWASANFAAIPEGVDVVFVSVAAAHTDNGALTEILLDPPQPTVGEAVNVICKIANYGPRARTFPVKLTFSDGTEFEHRVEVQPTLTASTTFRLRVREPGLLEGTVTIPNDGLQGDNKRHFTLRVTEQQQVAIISDEDRSDLKASHRFIATALSPFEDHRGFWAPTLLRSNEFDAFAASRSSAVVLSGLRAFDEAMAAVLVEYLRNGGGIVYFLASLADRANLNLLSKLAEGDLGLPFQAGALVGGARGDFAVFRDANYRSPVLKKFRETDSLAKLHFFRYFETRRDTKQGEVLVRYDNGHIALAQRGLGLGTLMMANFSVHADASDLAKHAAFVPLLHEMVKAVRPRSGGLRSHTVGAPCSTTVPLSTPNAAVSFSNPSGDQVSAGFEVRNNEAAVLFSMTDETGFYRVHEAGALAGAIAVNVDSLESNLEALSTEQLKELSQRSRDRFFASGGTDTEALRALREGIPLWHYMLLAGLCFLAMEQLCCLLWVR